MNTPESAGPAGKGTPSRARAVLGALSLLVIGAVLGIAIDRHLLLPSDHGTTAAAFHEMTMSALEERLDLTPDQRRQIDSIVAARHGTLEHAWQMLHTQLGAAVDTVHQEVEAVLTPAQRTEFAAWLREVIHER
jgi:Spy/CpxP family protein refolding chaperone